MAKRKVKQDTEGTRKVGNGDDGVHLEVGDESLSAGQGSHLVTDEVDAAANDNGSPRNGEHRDEPATEDSGSKPKRRPARGAGASRRRRSASNRVASGNSDSRRGFAVEGNVMSSQPFNAIGVAQDSGDSDVSDLADIVSRQWLLIVAIILVSTVLGAVTLSQMTPVYTAKAELIIQGERPALPTLEAVLPALGTDEQSILTESAVLRSGVLLESVVERLSLVDDPEFNSLLKPNGFLSGQSSSDDPESRNASPAMVRERVVNAIANRLKVSDIPDSRVIRVAFTSESPQKAADIANTVVGEYLESRKAAKLDASSETNSWLNERISELQAKLVESEKRTEQFRSDAELLEAGGTTLLSQQLADLNGHIIVARTATEAARAELTEVSDLIESSEGRGIYASEQLVQSPLIQELRREQVALEREIAELSSEYGSAHPRMVQLAADAKDLENQIVIEVKKVEQGLRNAVKVAEAREKGLERQAWSLKARLGKANEDQIELRALEREAQANRDLLEVLLARQKELGSPDQLQEGQLDARVISYAAVPVSPSFPQMGISVAAIFIVSTLVALVFAFVREVRREGFTTLEQLEAENRLTALGFVPDVTARGQQTQLLDTIMKKPGHPLAIAISTLSWQLDESMPADSGVVLMTSAVPGEGKTTMATGIAMTKAMKGQKTLLIDADMRDPSVHTNLGLTQGPGLRDVIEGRAEVADVIKTDEASSLDVLPAGQASADAFTFIESPRLDSLLDELVERYDYIIVDSPPVASAPDACALSKLADTTVLTVRWSETPVKTVKYVLRLLERNGGHITGTVLNRVEASKSLGRKKGYYGYYGDYGTSAAS